MCFFVVTLCSYRALVFKFTYTSTYFPMQRRNINYLTQTVKAVSYVNNHGLSMMPLELPFLLKLGFSRNFSGCNNQVPDINKRIDRLPEIMSDAGKYFYIKRCMRTQPAIHNSVVRLAEMLCVMTLCKFLPFFSTKLHVKCSNRQTVNMSLIVGVMCSS